MVDFNDNIPPDNMDDWMRWIESRLRKQERHRHPILTENWLIKEDSNGDLVAIHSGGQIVVLASSS